MTDRGPGHEIIAYALRAHTHEKVLFLAAERIGARAAERRVEVSVAFEQLPPETRVAHARVAASAKRSDAVAHIHGAGDHFLYVVRVPAGQRSLVHRDDRPAGRVAVRSGPEKVAVAFSEVRCGFLVVVDKNDALSLCLGDSPVAGVGDALDGLGDHA